jgi:lipopolysaccharide export system protein LptA
MARWQRYARFGFGLFAIAFALALWFVIGRRQPPAPPAAVERLDPKAVSEIRGGDVVQVKGAKRDIRVEFATQVLYSDGSANYTGFKAFVDDRGGRSFEISGADAHVAPEQSAFDVRGDVVLKTSDGLTAKTTKATFAEADGVLNGDGPVTFTRERLTGSGVGFKYERSIDRLELRDKAVINVAPGDDSQGMAVTAGSVAYSRLERFMRFERGMRMERQGQVIEADASTVFLLKDRDEPELVELRGHSKITGAEGSSSVQSMQAQDINLRYAPDGRTLQHALLVGQSTVTLSRADGSVGQRLDAETLDVTLAPDGAVTALAARDNTRVTIPPTATASAREITSQTLTGTGSPGRGLTQMLFETKVVYREDVKGASPRVVQARTLNASLAEGGAIERALFSGGFTFEEGRLTAQSLEAIYDVAKSTLELRGPESAPQPHVKNERVDLRANTIDANLSPLALRADGKVRALFAAGRREGERGASVLNQDEGVVVICDNLSFDEQSGAGVYTGSARLFQSQSGNEIRGDTIMMNAKTGMLAADGNVVTQLPLASKGEGAKGLSIGRADRFEFDDGARKATFTTKAHLEGAQGDLQAQRIDVLLAAKGNDLRELTAEGTVVIKVENREATGQHLVHHPADDSYVLTGAPARLVDGCEESSGRTITFYRGSNRVLVNGSEQSRAQAKSGKCPDSRQDR